MVQGLDLKSFVLGVQDLGFRV